MEIGMPGAQIRCAIRILSGKAEIRGEFEDGFESLVGAAGIEPATLCLAAGPAFLRGLDYIFGIAAALLIVSEDSPLRAVPFRRGCLLIALSGSQHTAASSIRVHFPACAPY